MNLGFSTSLAFVLGALLPVLGMVRIWTMPDAEAGSFFADLLSGGMLLFGAVQTRNRAHTGQRFLAAGYGLTFGIFYTSLIDQLQPKSGSSLQPEGDIPTEWMIVPAIIGLMLAGVGLLASLRSIRPK
jgi:hypothetical protein